MLNIGELIKELSKYPPASLVLITWEGTTQGIEEDEVYQLPSGTVMLDADANFYKDSFVSGERKE